MNPSHAVFIINLEHRTDRRAAMQRELSRVDWPGEFFPAIRTPSAGGFPSVGARGCFLSHLEVLRKARALGVRRLVILEDDLNFAPDLAARWTSAISELEGLKWSIFYPGH